ncbi:MAG: hypothetical protein KatS3mg111_0722 [Pirellulaceae bacterium]|nr:MAG: hypothetical protein KatS3mg111_0722 [Pirellulaceae bacterium]
MNRRWKLLLLVASVGMLVVGASSSRGADNNWGLAWLYGYQGYPYTSVHPSIPAPPYFAMHPPVYYGQRYARPYGVSPFAAWPQLQPSDGYRPTPHVNRWQTGSAMGAPCCAVQATTSSPLAISPQQPPTPVVIDNPYFDAADASSPFRYTTTD